MAPTLESVSATSPPPLPPPHFVVVPLPAQGHTIPMLPLEIVGRSFSPSAADAGLPPGVENVDQITDYAHFRPFFDVMRHLAAPLEAYLRALPVPPSCVISDWSNPWTAGVASRVGVPRLFFHGPSCFYSLCDLNAAAHGLQQQGDDDRILQLTMEAMRTADGAVVNTFKDPEDEFIACYEAALGKPSAITTWLDGMDTDSVIYVNFGSLARKVPKYLFEVGHGLEDSGKPFIWVVKVSEVATREVQEWLSALEARVAGRGLVVRGWAPQLAILSHRAVGGFVTHCGWNSMLESIAHGVPVVTWPHFSDQFLNERLAVDVLGVGVPVGVTTPVLLFGDEAMAVTRGDVARAVAALMDGGEEAGERRRKAKEYGEKARRAMEKGGSSYESLTQLIHSFTLHGAKNALEH
uniref:Glycosyltransferase n=1 Tax=Oryza barthii TaxID=65489 RepID=A0A0D3F281_9ORYZ